MKWQVDSELDGYLFGVNTIEKRLTNRNYIARFYLFILFALVVNIFGQTAAKSTGDEPIPAKLMRLIDLELENATIIEALALIMEVGEIDLSYNIERLGVDGLINVDTTAISIHTALKLVTQQSGTELKITRRGSVLILPGSPQHRSLTGRITDAENGDGLAGR